MPGIKVVEKEGRWHYTVCQKNVPIEPTFLELVMLDYQERMRYRQTVSEWFFIMVSSF